MQTGAEGDACVAICGGAGGVRACRRASGEGRMERNDERRRGWGLLLHACRMEVKISVRLWLVDLEVVINF